MDAVLSQTDKNDFGAKKNFKDLGHIGVLMGGYSSEREISLKSGGAILAALQEAGCQVSGIDITTKNENEISSRIKDSRLDVAFIALHGRLGEDGTIQSILESLKIPYPGSGIEASRRAINKAITQNILKQKGIRVPEHIILSNPKDFDEQRLLKSVSLPVVVKPSCEGSSIGVTCVRQKEQLDVAVTDAFSYGNEVLVENCIQGKELTVGILGQEPLPVIEICPKAHFFDFSSKYQTGMTEYLIPAKIPAGVAREVQSIALDSHLALGCEDFSRVDIMLDDQSRPFVLEINTIPGFTSTSLLPKAAKSQGMDFTSLCIKLIQFAYEKKR